MSCHTVSQFRYLLIILFCLYASTTQAQIDTLFWFAAPEVSQDGPTNDFDRPIVLRMTAFAQAAIVTISQPACTGCMPLQTLNIPAGTTTSLDLTLWIDSIENKPPNTVLNYGLKVQSTAPISAYYHEVSTNCTCNPEFFVLKGQNAMGTDFWIPSQNFLDNATGYTPTPYSSFDIVATQNNTTVTITPSSAIVGHAAGTAFTVTLNAGQTYSATAASQAAAQHLQGSRVTSNLPITINVKDDLLSGGIYGSCADLAGDQIVPTNVVGTEYIAMNGSLNAPGDQLFITATQNATSISQDGTFVTSINAGQTYQLSVGGPSTYIQTSLPAYVYQLSGIGCEVGSAILPSIICTGSNSVSFNQSTNLSLYVNLMVKNGGQGNFLVNGAAGVITAAQFAAVPGTAGVWYAAHISLSTVTYPQNSVVSVTNTSSLFQLGLLTGSVMTGTAFGYFSNFGGLNANISANGPVCSGSTIHLSVDTSDNATYNWIGPNSFSSNSSNPSISNAISADSGIYIVNVFANGCTATDTLLVAVIPPKTSAVSLTICSDSSIVFAGNTIDTPGIYTHSYTTPDGCDSIATLNLTFIYPPDSLSLTMDHTACIGREINAALNGNTQNLDYLWAFDSADIVSGSGPGPYLLNWHSTGTKYIQVSTSNTCGTLSYSDSLNIYPLPIAKIANVSNANICGGDTILLSAYSAQGYIYKWQPQNIFADAASPQVTAIVLEPGNIILTVQDSMGCVAADSIYLSVDPCCHISLPNAFSPNKDGKNDIYRIISLSHDQLIFFRIANRWGQIVFDTKDIGKGWDGTINGTPAEIGTYFYVLKYKCVDNREVVQKGDLTLIR